ncbi:uncharacterized protein FRV6_05152 [Fusarium oxysporum]|uniref:Uncharacterized protein n=1 Tax=Fusarium oxysporum TaxID=5507 RepID=A0A2H3T094_FUSOX|nr:uncharacterized protein FRV6_05152 [Fusarium oxysporum]
MDETTRLELKSLISATGSRISGNASILHSAGVGESLRQSSPSWLRRVGLAVLLLLIPIAYAALEFLLTSQTTASALKNILTMGWIGSWAICVIAVWSLSPLGGQAALRSLGLQQNPMFTELPATYYLGNNKSEIYQYYRSGASVFIGPSAEQSMISDMRTVLSASFSTQDVLVSHANTSSPHYNDIITDLGGKWEASCRGCRGLWRNIRIPFLELLPAYDASDPHTWISVPEDEIVPYASLIGLPIRGSSFERLGNSTMAVHFHYQTLSRGKAFNGSEWVRSGSMALWSHNTSSSVPLSQQYNGRVEPNMGCRSIWFDFSNSSTITEHFTASFETEPQSKLQLVIGGLCTTAVGEKSEILRLCDISTSYIDMEVACSRATADADLFDKDIYKLNKPWFITTILSTAVLMICAVANLVVRQRIKAPDFLDSVAGLTKDSPFVDVSQDGSGKGGSDRLETIKDVKVRI